MSTQSKTSIQPWHISVFFDTLFILGIIYLVPILLVLAEQIPNLFGVLMAGLLVFFFLGFYASKWLEVSQANNNSSSRIIFVIAFAFFFMLFYTVGMFGLADWPLNDGNDFTWLFTGVNWGGILLFIFLFILPAGNVNPASRSGILIQVLATLATNGLLLMMAVIWNHPSFDLHPAAPLSWGLRIFMTLLMFVIIVLFYGAPRLLLFTATSNVKGAKFFLATLLIMAWQNTAPLP